MSRKTDPYIVRKRTGKRPFKIIERKTGKTWGTSITRVKATHSAAIRNAYVREHNG